MKVGSNQRKAIHKSLEGYGVSSEYIDEMIALYEEGETELASELLYWGLESEELKFEDITIDENYPHDFGETGEVQMSVRVRRIKESQSGN